MKKSLFLLTLLLSLFLQPLSAQQTGKNYVVGFYNLENLFDTDDDPTINDQDFLPEGKNQWTDVKYRTKLKNMAHVIRAMAEDNGMFHTILGISEIENRRVVEDLLAEPELSGSNFRIIHYDGPDRRGVDVGMLYRADQFTPLETQSIPFSFEGTQVPLRQMRKEMEYFRTRDVLMVRGLLNGEMFAFYVAHLPSRGKKEDFRNLGAEIIYKHTRMMEERFPGIKIVVMGDMNDDPFNDSMAHWLHGRENLEDVAPGDFFNPYWSMLKAGYGTLCYHDVWSIFDQELVNYNLAFAPQGGLRIRPIVQGIYYGRVFRKDFMAHQSGPYKGYPLRTFSSGVFIGGYSDHFPTYIVLEAPADAPEADPGREDLSDLDLMDSGYNDAPSVLYRSGNVYESATGYGFSAIRYKHRGYNSETQEPYLAGVPLNDAVTGYSPYSLWTGLNEITRTKETVSALGSSEFTPGGFNGAVNILANPSSVRPGLRASVLTNSATYRLRLMLTYASGRRDDGWSYAFSASARVGGNDWIKGVYYRTFAYYAGVEKRIGYAHRLSFFTFASPGERGAQNASTQEVYNLMGDNLYNSNWGYQNGKLRNSRVVRTFEPVTVLRYEWTPSARFSGAVSLLWRTGVNGRTALDWYDAPDPRPDYYRNLPSYAFMEENDDTARRNPDKADWLRETWTNPSPDYDNYRHVNWDRMYRVNSLSADGRSKYALEERHADQNDVSLAGSLKWNIRDNLTLQAGGSARWNHTAYYKKLADLLGGSYFLNIDSFAERDYAASEEKIQNDLNYYLAHGQAEKVTLGGRYGYDYRANVLKAKAWANLVWRIGALELKPSVYAGGDAFWRVGMVRKGLFPGPHESFGRSAYKRFYTGGGKLSGSYFLTGGHRFFLSGGYFLIPPTFQEAFISPRTRNSVVEGLRNRMVASLEAGYAYNGYGWQVSATGYWTQMRHGSKVMSFYDDSQNSFTNFAMTGIDQRHLGVELGVQAPLFVSGLTVTAVLTLGEHVYTSNPDMVQTVDNSAEIIRRESVAYWKSHPVYKRVNGAVDVDVDGNFVVEREQKHYVPGSPQIAAQLSLNYQTRDYWYMELNGQFFAKSYLDMNPLYRTAFAVAGPDGITTPEEVEYMAAQEEFPAVFLLNASVGKNWNIRDTQLGVSLSLNNLLNNRNVRTGGYEQTRLIPSVGRDRYYRFDSKYFYMTGFNYMLNVYFRF